MTNVEGRRTNQISMNSSFNHSGVIRPLTFVILGVYGYLCSGDW